MESTQAPNDLLYDLALSRIEGIGAVLYKQLVLHFGTAKNVLQSSKSRLKKVPGVGIAALSKFSRVSAALSEADTILSDCQKLGIDVCTFRSPSYPALLAETFDCPPVLYKKGRGELYPHRTLGIVGTRHASPYGKEIVAQLCATLPEVQIISGLAYGIDIAAHREALKNGKSTVAVLAHGLDTVYPRSHRKVAEELQESGLLLSEHPPFTALHPQLFISRNRIIAGLSNAVVVVESGDKGGSMVTAEYANNYNRDVFAVPGDLYRKQAQGPTKLIHEHKAHIYLRPEQLAECLRWDTGSAPPPLLWASEEEKKVMELLQKHGEMGIDELAWKTQNGLNSLACLLLELEFRDLICQLPGKKFRLR